MFECEVCGLLSLGGHSCPACGSLLRKDLTEDVDADEFGEVPGLDDAVDSFYDFEGTEPPEVPEPVPATTSSSSLPFGFQGQSNVIRPGLPFGIGSYSTGMPFDVHDDEESSENEEGKQTENDLWPTQITIENKHTETPKHTIAEEVFSSPISEPVDVRPGPVDVRPEPVIDVTTNIAIAGDGFFDDINVNIDPFVDDQVEIVPKTFIEELPELTPLSDEVMTSKLETTQSEIVRLSGARIISEPVQTDDVPDYWKIDAEIPDYESIYNDAPQVVEMEYSSLEDDVVMYDHNSESATAVYHTPLEHSVVTQQPMLLNIELELHPSQAMAIDLGERRDLAHFVQQGFMAFQSGQWIDAAQSFQRLASEFPQQPAVFNNYGLALFERAKELDATPGSEHLASSQYDSSILALREAAKLAPQQSEILLNLSSALFTSGRAEKALGIVNVHNQQHPTSTRGQNAAGVLLHALGQELQAKQMFSSISHMDDIAHSNLRKLN